MAGNGACGRADQLDVNFKPRKLESSTEPKIGTIDNGHEYLGKGVWMDTETGKEYSCDSRGRVKRETIEGKRGIFSDLYHNFFGLD